MPLWLTALGHESAIMKCDCWWHLLSTLPLPPVYKYLCVFNIKLIPKEHYLKSVTAGQGISDGASEVPWTARTQVADFGARSSAVRVGKTRMNHNSKYDMYFSHGGVRAHFTLQHTPHRSSPLDQQCTSEDQLYLLHCQHAAMPGYVIGVR